MKFHLNYTPKKSSFQIQHQHSVLLIGSCFSENIATLLKESRFKTLSNPNGILFNPLSIYQCIKNALQNKGLHEKLILERDNQFYSYLHHTSFHASSIKELLQNLNATTHQTHETLKECDILIITFGTAYFYYHKELQQSVANCHKQAANTFEKKLLEVDEIISLYSELVKDLQAFNPSLKIIFTVSPVKYLKDGLQENNLSKSTLLLSIHKLINAFSNCFYFPSFELVNDDLRDYRFYKEDLAHPNQLAIDYIWEKFSDCYFDSKTKELNIEIQKLNSALNHRQMQQNLPETEKLQSFIEKQKSIIKKLDSNIEF